MTRLCICKICTCGRHRCPHFPQGRGQPVEPCTFSEYTNRYVQHPIEPRKDYKPQAKPAGGDGAMEDKTTHRVDYIEHPLGTRYVHQGEKYRAPEGEFDPLTSYNKEYTKKPLETVKAIRQPEGQRALGKFAGEPTYTADYRKWDPQRRELVKADNRYSAPAVPFDGNTNYQTDYVRKQQAMRESMRPNEASMRSDAPFDDATEHRHSYVRHPLQAREARKEAVWEPNTTALDDLTTHRRDYTPKEAGRARSCKPDLSAYTSTTPFDGSTTHNADYIRWQLEKPAQRQAEAYQKPPGEMESSTTTHTDYTKKPFSRQVAWRPQEAKRALGKFDDMTNYRTEYVKWGLGDRAQPVPQPPYQPNDAPFDGMPTYQRDYVAKRGEMARSLKPIDSGYRSGAPLDDATEYRVEYAKKWIAPCPVPLIESGRDVGFAFAEQDASGHKWYNFTANEAQLKGGVYGTLVK